MTEEAVLLAERERLYRWLDAYRKVTDTGFGMGEAEIVYEACGRRISVKLTIEEDPS
ncbi:MAG: hypothetical protein M0030_03350 [Actinomycetota bacterium]|nr:hypothetical protein [Actinomycetota bacterium]